MIYPLGTWNGKVQNFTAVCAGYIIFQSGSSCGKIDLQTDNATTRVWLKMQPHCLIHLSVINGENTMAALSTE